MMKRLCIILCITLLALLVATPALAQDQVETIRVLDRYDTILLFLGAVIAAVGFIAVKLALNMRDMLPPAVTPFLPIMMNVLVELAKKTQTPMDDELIQKLKGMFGETPNDGGVG